MSPHLVLCYIHYLPGAGGTPEELSIAVCTFDSLCPDLLCSRARWYTHSWITRAARTRSIRMNRWSTPTFAKTEDNPWTKTKLIRSPYQLFFLGILEKWCSFLCSFCFFFSYFVLWNRKDKRVTAKAQTSRKPSGCQALSSKFWVVKPIERHPSCK